ncbi:hypothetical protein [Neorhizobium galegae]|uniref:hypothetical protein n=1 Tax=Neorhizobium galegae TaxID=399 RepID=UPI0012D569B0|nr:hypothetical protein [Neorhizobium galegae]KAB1123937.1 hypothetical protein F4V90_09850 [Neorhizobium galegae]MCQ1806732.1 hypothetical protein [Neorhizobium galegae]
MQPYGCSTFSGVKMIDERVREAANSLSIEISNNVSPGLRRTIGLVGCWVSLGFLPLFTKIFGYGFLPSSSWVSSTNLLGHGVGLACAGISWWIIRRGGDGSPSDAAKVCAAFTVLLIIYFIGRTAIVISLAVVLALVAGRNVELPFTISERVNEKGCKSGIYIERSPFLFESFCGIPKDQWNTLRAGDHVIIEGYGTSLGIFASSLRKSD